MSGDPGGPRQPGLFGEPDLRRQGPTPAPPTPPPVRPVNADAGTLDLAAALGPRIRLGTSSWHFPGWQGQVWADRHPAAELSRRGLCAYAAHPLLRTVSLDRAFYRVLEPSAYAALAAQVDAGFRFVVKAPAALSDAALRDAATGRALRANPGFLDPAIAAAQVRDAAVAGLGERLGVLVLQLSPLPSEWLGDRPRLHAALERCLQALRPARIDDHGPWLAVEVRDPGLLDAEFSAVLRACGALYALGLHDRMPDAEGQLPMLRRQWPAPLVCRWNLRRGLRYDDARGRFEPFDRLQSPDLPTRATVARVAAATAAAGQDVYVTINNKAEGSAPASVQALAEAILAVLPQCRQPASASRGASGSTDPGACQARTTSPQ